MALAATLPGQTYREPVSKRAGKRGALNLSGTVLLPVVTTAAAVAMVAMVVVAVAVKAVAAVAAVAAAQVVVGVVAAAVTAHNAVLNPRMKKPGCKQRPHRLHGQRCAPRASSAPSSV